MKKLLIIALIAIEFMACEPTKTVKDVSDKTEIPNIVYKSLKDTILKFNSVIVETEKKLYIVQEINKERTVVKEIDREIPDEFGIGVLAGLILGIIIIILIAGIFDALD